LSYIIGQYNHTSTIGDDSSYITPIKSGVVARRGNPGDMGVIGGSLNPFVDECITGLNLSPYEYYYFRGQVKRMTDSQVFTIKLVNYESTGTEEVEQFVKQVTIRGGDREEWVSVEFIFHPVAQFDTILFQLQRTIADYRQFARTPKIAYQQLGVINSIINSKIANGVSLLKIGVQSHPGLTLCVNGEEMHVSRSGIYEVKNGVLPVNFFSVVNAAEELNQDASDATSVEGWKAQVNAAVEEIENDPTLTIEQKEARYKAIDCKCFFSTTKIYKIDPFILDYMYDNV
jgi:hypothetical protein